MKQKFLAGAIVLLAAAGALTWYMTSKNNPSAPPGDSSHTFNDLGLKATLPQSLNDIKPVTIRPPAGSKASLSSVTSVRLDSYTALANKCLGLPPSTKQSFANLVRVKSLAPGMPEPLRRINGTYIVNLGASLPSNVTCKDKATQQQLTNLSNSLNNDLDQALKTATST